MFLVNFALGNCVGLDQARGASSIRGGEVDSGFRSSQLPGSPIHFSQEGTRIDGEQRITLFHQLPVLEMHRHDGAGHQWTNVDPVDGFKPTRVTLPLRDGLRDHSGNVDFSGWRFGGSGFGRADNIGRFTVIGDVTDSACDG
ncbi:hypothetical protein D3C75_1067700 [compost metagenome]